MRNGIIIVLQNNASIKANIFQVATTYQEAYFQAELNLALILCIVSYTSH